MCDRCSYPWPHEHYERWIRRFISHARCRCGEHVRVLTVNDLLRAWKR